ncbi:MAG: PaaI family thioesterase [Gammaproteobacteria bacterium]|nr:PaaI family thioesterase [Gammaproteobacteria bacterium]
MTDPSTDATTYDGKSCFVCGPENPISLGVKFRLEDDICKAEFTPEKYHSGWDGVTHGGIIFSVLDDVMANWIYLNGMKGYTAKCDVRFRNPLPTGCKVLLEGTRIKQRRNMVVLEGKVIRADNQELIADCQASFMLAD